MAAPQLALSPGNSPRNFDWLPRLPQWWQRLTLRCAGVDCPHRGKLWPHRFRKSSGIEFDGRWYCEIACLKPLITLRAHNLLFGFLQDRARTYRVPLGLMLVNRGVLSATQLREALRRQREAGHGRIGDWLSQLGIIDDLQLTAALGQQWGCPVFPLQRAAVAPALSGVVPIPILESVSAVPAYSSADGRVLHLAFSERLDHTTLYGVEQMLGCRTFPCVASHRAVASLLEQLRRVSPSDDPCFDTIREPVEMTWAIANYAVELQAQRISLVRAGAFIWVRFFRRSQTRDLLFRVLPAAPSLHPENNWPSSKVSSFAADERKDSVPDATGVL